MEHVWKEHKDQLNYGENDIKAWARCGAEIIEEMDEQNSKVRLSDLTLMSDNHSTASSNYQIMDDDIVPDCNYDSA
eukprot:7162855-Ditylum_brightwellii.AAC.1